MPTAVKEEVFEITRATVGLTERDITYATIDYSPQIMWEYPVPVGYALVFTREDILSLMLVSASQTECIDTTVFVDVVVMDSSKQNVRSLVNLCQYGTTVEFAEVTKLKRMDIAPGDQVIANEGERVCIRANSRTSALATIDVNGGYSFFRLTCKRVRHTLFG